MLILFLITSIFSIFWIAYLMVKKNNNKIGYLYFILMPILFIGIYFLIFGTKKIDFKLDNNKYYLKKYNNNNEIATINYGIDFENNSIFSNRGYELESKKNEKEARQADFDYLKSIIEETLKDSNSLIPITVDEYNEYRAKHVYNFYNIENVKGEKYYIKDIEQIKTIETIINDLHKKNNNNMYDFYYIFMIFVFGGFILSAILNIIHIKKKVVGTEAFIVGFAPQNTGYFNDGPTVILPIVKYTYEGVEYEEYCMTPIDEPEPNKPVLINVDPENPRKVTLVDTRKDEIKVYIRAIRFTLPTLVIVIYSYIRVILERIN